MKRELQHFLVAIDGSDASNRAVDVAAEMAKSADGTLSIITAALPLSEDQKAEFKRIAGEYAEAADILAQRTLQAAHQRACWSELSPSKITTIFRWGEPTEVIVDCIVKEKMDVVIVGRRGQGEPAGHFMGSISQELAALSPCAVVVVP